MGSATNRSLISLAATLCLIIIHSTPAHSSNDSPTAYKVLENYNLPVGLLPKGVQGYDLNTSTGKFLVYFNDTCSFSLRSSYQLKYNPTIKCYISKGKISSLEGVSVKFFSAWTNIEKIFRSGDDLHFSVGVSSAGFPIHYFKKSPQCGCGFSCGHGN